MSAREVVIIGAGGHAREIAELIEAVNAAHPTYVLLGFLVEPAYARPGTMVEGYPVLGDIDWIAGHHGVEVISGVGAPALRRRLAERAASHGARFGRLTHPSASVGTRVDVGEGAMVQAGCVVTTGVWLGRHAHVNVGATVSHDCVLGDFATLAPGVHAAGAAILDEGCDVGVGASIHPGCRIGAWSVVGAGSVVIDDVPPDTVVAGVPARPIRALSPGWHLV